MAQTKQNKKARGNRDKQDRNNRQGRQPQERRKDAGKGGAGTNQRRRRPNANPGTLLASQATLIEGRRAVAEAIDQKIPLVCAYVADEAGRRDKKFDRILKLLQEQGTKIKFVTNEFLDKNSAHGSHQGIILEAAPYEYAEVEDILNATRNKKDALVVLLDHVTDEGNFGAIVRSAEVVGASGVVIPNARSAKVGIAACTTSVGAVFQLPVAQVANLATAIEMFQEEGYWVFGSTEHADDVIWDSPMHGKCVLVMGSEGSGISRLVQEKCDFLCKLPQAGNIESLNVAQAATVMCFEWMRQTHEVSKH